MFFKVTVKQRLWIISVSSSKSLVTCHISIRTIQFVSSVAWYFGKKITIYGLLILLSEFKIQSEYRRNLTVSPMKLFMIRSRTKINIAFNSHYVHIYDSKLLILRINAEADRVCLQRWVPKPSNSPWTKTKFLPFLDQSPQMTFDFLVTCLLFPFFFIYR